MHLSSVRCDQLAWKCDCGPTLAIFTTKVYISQHFECVLKLIAVSVFENFWISSEMTRTYIIAR